MVLPSLIYGMIELSSEDLFLEFVCLLFYPPRPAGTPSIFPYGSTAFLADIF
jgi:hypothetical protein